MLTIEKSIAYFNEAKELLPGGVDSPVRAFKAVGGQPLFIQKGEGAYLTDVDGNRAAGGNAFGRLWPESALFHRTCQAVHEGAVVVDEQ